MGEEEVVIVPFFASHIGILWDEAKMAVEFDRYNEMLFMIDTCQANTMYSRFYSPNIIATGSSEIDQSSYSHHADNDVGVAVIDRYTYYNLDFLETQVREPSSKKTLADLFDSYDESKIHSHPGVRWDLFRGGEEEGRKRLVMDFFGNVQNVEVGDAGGVANETEWKEDLVQLGKMITAARKVNETGNNENSRKVAQKVVMDAKAPQRKPGAVRVEAEAGWGSKVLGAWALGGCALMWFAGSWIESSR